MISLKVLWLGLLLFICLKVYGECPNGCSAHGRCGQYDMCTCYRNWMGEDCSQRICPFGVAYVDSPKGDLDYSKGLLSGPDTKVAVHSFLYPEGTTEQYPKMATSRGEILSNTAHEYRECSNAGYCNRETGECDCFPGFEGSACSRMSCPTTVENKECSGHGVCRTAAELAAKDSENHYKLWDEDHTMGCDCDGHYSGAACEQRLCKIGFDPLYPSDYGRRYANISYVLYTNSPTASISGNYSIRFFDALGQDWETDEIDYTADCKEVIAALEALPNGVIPRNSVRCLKFSDFHASTQTDEPILAALGENTFYGIKYTLLFPGNPGDLRPIQLNFFLDGKRPTIMSDEAGHPVQSFVYSHGFHGETTDFFTEFCAGVEFSFSEYYNGGEEEAYQYLTGLTPVETRLLQRCLGDADGDPDTFSDTGVVFGAEYTWDYGDMLHPHLIKVVPRSSPRHPLLTDICDGTVNNYRDGQGVAAALCAYPTHRVSPYSGAGPGAGSQSGGESGGETGSQSGGESGTGGQTGVGSGGESGPLIPGFFTPLVYDPVRGVFKIFTKPLTVYSPTTVFSLFTTTSVVQVVNPGVTMITHPGGVYRDRVYSIPTVWLNNTGLGARPTDYTSPVDLTGTTTSATGTTTASDISGTISDIIGTSSDITGTPSDITGEVGCESTVVGSGSGALDCVDRNDRVLFFHPDTSLSAYQQNPQFLTLYRVEKVGKLSVQQVHRTFSASVNVSSDSLVALYSYETVLDKAVTGVWTGYRINNAGDLVKMNNLPVNTPVNSPVDLPVNSPVNSPVRRQTDIVGDGLSGIYHSNNMKLYRIRAPDATITSSGEGIAATPYAYATPCSNRGNCLTETGQCECFAGFTADDCSQFYNYQQ